MTKGMLEMQILYFELNEKKKNTHTKHIIERANERTRADKKELGHDKGIERHQNAREREKARKSGFLCSHDTLSSERMMAIIYGIVDA